MWLFWNDRTALRLTLLTILAIDLLPAFFGQPEDLFCAPGCSHLVRYYLRGDNALHLIRTTTARIHLDPAAENYE